MSLNDESQNSNNTRRLELNTFLFLTVFLAPILSIIIVGSYGLIIWVMQMFFGPPTG
ncbi:MAG: periplasmic nitrate reductase, NapE protein [Kangiellaceae bacterium]|nr:periplasmic nitrate reductase, NapE protein [Kangiellaceae bacterium]MCW9000111.1 periplasmic nitrate reductase, NapE protein [Kangiellaceae bacterium]